MLNDNPVSINRRKTRALLYYLAANLEPVPRERLLTFFWPDLTRVSAQQVLRSTLYGMRASLGEWIQSCEDQISLVENTWIDVRIFEENLMDPTKIDKLTDGVNIYKGGFLSDFYLPDSQEFDDWLVVERQRYQNKLMRSLILLAKHYEDQGDNTRALEFLEHSLRFDPLQEDIQREAMRLQFLAGDRPGAIRRYDELRQLLDREMGVPPMLETRKMYDSILSDKPQVLTKSLSIREPKIKAGRKLPDSNQIEKASQSPFVGRHDELQVISQKINQQRLILIEGEAGIGKTRLVEEFIQQSSFLPLVGRAYELEQHIPYQPLIEALRGLTTLSDWPALWAEIQHNIPPVWLAEINRILPGIVENLPDQSVWAANEPRLWEGISQFLRELGKHRPWVLWFDDIHWADASTLPLLGFLLRQPFTEEVGFIATTREVPPRSALASLAQILHRENRLTRLQLRRLTLEEIRALSDHWHLVTQDDLLEWLYKNSEGNPYYLVEQVRQAQERDVIDHHGRFQPDKLTQAPGLPAGVYQVIRERLERLTDNASRVLNVAVAIGRVFDYRLVVEASGLSDEDVIDALDELRFSRLIIPQDSQRFSFDHNLTLEAAYQLVGELRHRVLHHKVAEAIEKIEHRDLDKVAGLLAFHYSEGNDPERAARFAYMAGQQATKLAAWTEAIDYFTSALTDSPAKQRLPILVALGTAHLKAGHYAKASEVFREAFKLAHSSDLKDLRNLIIQQLAGSLLPQARFAEVIELATELLSANQPESAMMAELLWATALSIEGADLEGAKQHLNNALIYWYENPDNDPAVLSQIQFEYGSILAQQGDIQQAIEYYRQALASVEKIDSEQAIERRILAYNNLAYHLLLVDDDRALEYAQSGLMLAQDRGVVGLQAYLYSTLGEIALKAGRLHDAEKLFTQGLEIAEMLAVEERVAGLNANLGLLAIKKGDIPIAIYRLAKAIGLVDALGTHHLAAQIRIWLAPLLPAQEARLRLDEARAIIEGSQRKRLLAEIEAVEERIELEMRS